MTYKSSWLFQFHAGALELNFSSLEFKQVTSVSESQYKQKHSDDDVGYSDDPGEFQTAGVFLHA